MSNSWRFRPQSTARGYPRSPIIVSTLVVLLTISNTAKTVGGGGGGIGVNWGTQANNPLSPGTVVTMLKDNGIRKVKLFDADKAVLNSLSGSGIEVMVGIPNELLYTLANDNVAAQNWVSQNISSHVSSSNGGGGGGGGVDIRYVAVGNEPFLKTLNGSYLSTTLPALQNIQMALNKAGLSNQIKVTVPLNADVYESSSGLPSGGDFRPDIRDLMISLVEFLHQNDSPLTVNIYPFISLYSSTDFPKDYAFFNGYSSPLQDNNGKTYSNMFDANYDTLVWALQKNGYSNLSIIVGEIGWPSDGDINANLNNAERFNQGFIKHVSGGNGTPMSTKPVEAYLFSLIDEDAKSIQPGKFERHWGMFYFDGTPKYQLNLGTENSGDLVAAKGVRHLDRKWCIVSPLASVEGPQIEPSMGYACGHADCTSLGYGCSCEGLDTRGNISYAFNSYYQANKQQDTACKFPNLSIVTTSDPSSGTCKFFIGVETSSSTRVRFLALAVWVSALWVSTCEFL